MDPSMNSTVYILSAFSTLSTVLSSFLSSMLLWLGSGFPVAEQKILGVELRFHSKFSPNSRICGARSEKKKEIAHFDQI